MGEIKVYLTLEVPDQYVETMTDQANTQQYIFYCLREMAEGLEGNIEDLEIK